MELRVKKIHKDAKLPSYGHVGDAGLDLFSVMGCVLKGGEARAISTGIQVAVMTNLSTKTFSIEKGMKIAQMLIQPIIKVKVVNSEELDETSRGEDGFGSTGKY
jgi:dUTP pyrophosphatase